MINLEDAAIHGDMDAVKRFHKSAGTKEAENGLAFAALNGELEVVKYLVGQGVAIIPQAMQWTKAEGHQHVMDYFVEVLKPLDRVQKAYDDCANHIIGRDEAACIIAHHDQNHTPKLLMALVNDFGYPIKKYLSTKWKKPAAAIELAYQHKHIGRDEAIKLILDCDDNLAYRLTALLLIEGVSKDMIDIVKEELQL